MYSFVPTSTIKSVTSVDIKEWDSIKTIIPSVMSASGVTKTGETSDGSTAARLEVARPKSPTAHPMRTNFENYEDKITFAIALAI